MKMLTLYRGQDCESIAFADGALHPDHYNATRVLRAHELCATRKVDDISNRCTAPDAGAKLDPWNEQSVERGLMMDLQMSFSRTAGDACDLSAVTRFCSGHQPKGEYQPAQAKVERREIGAFNVALTPTFGVDSRNAALGGRTEGATGKERSGPAPEAVEAGGHCALHTFDRCTHTGYISHPWMKPVGRSGAVKIGVMGYLRQHLFVKQTRETARRRATATAGKTARKVCTIIGAAAGTGQEGDFIKHGDHHNRSAEYAGLPVLHPLMQQSWSLVFVPMGGTIDQQDRARSATPDEDFEAHAIPGDAAAAEPRVQGS